jgi:hypothetical protein
VKAERRISRRAFVILGASVAGAAGGVKLLTGGGESDESPAARHELTRRVRASFTDLEAAREVGRAYLRTHPRENDEDRLVRLLRSSRPAWRRPVRPDEIMRTARREVRRDYVAGRLVIADGWYLSRTEARLCALATFS